MSKVVQLANANPLVGTWVGEGDDARAEYTIVPNGGSFAVAGIDGVDGERFQISEITWDGTELRFTSLMPSTGRIVKHVFRSAGASAIRHTFTFTDSEIWRRKA